MIQLLMKKLRNKKGFTLIELIVVIAILGILAAIIIPQFTGFQDKAKSTQALVDAKQVATAFDALAIEKDGYAAVTEDEVANMSKVPATEIALADDGTFTVTVTGGFQAGRTVVDGPVHMIEAAA